MVELVALLLPIAAAWGWYAAKRHYSARANERSGRNRTEDYCRGLNYLLREKADKAIDILAGLIEQDPETAETQIALGNLFRRRGDVERAIATHESLLVHSSITEKQKAYAYFELGVDYTRAGLLDRAERIFDDLRHSDWRGAQALEQLLQIYQQEKDWARAVDCARELERMGRQPTRGEKVSQFQCEIAERELSRGDSGAAEGAARAALKSDPNCVRASLILGRIYLARDAVEPALKSLLAVEKQQPSFLAEAWPQLRECWMRQRKSDQHLKFARRYFKHYGLLEAAFDVAEHVGQSEGLDAARRFLEHVLDRYPNLETLRKLLESLSARQDIPREAVDGMMRAVSRLVAGSPRYCCAKCGFSGMDLHWRCPSCQQWESTLPAKTPLEGSVAMEQRFAEPNYVVEPRIAENSAS